MFSDSQDNYCLSKFIILAATLYFHSIAKINLTFLKNFFDYKIKPIRST